MPGYERDQAVIDGTVENRHLGSVMLTLGWMLLCGDAIVGVFFFQSLRDGSMLWPAWLAIEGVVGLALIIMGTRYRRAIGVTRLGRADIRHTLEQERREEAENRHVA